MTDGLVIICAAAGSAISALPGIIAAIRIAKVKEIVDGPLSLALKQNAEMAATIAALTGDHRDLKAALDAKAVNENRQAGKQQP